LADTDKDKRETSKVLQNRLRAFGSDFAPLREKVLAKAQS
jgi:hypothetical protein